MAKQYRCGKDTCKFVGKSPYEVREHYKQNPTHRPKPKPKGKRKRKKAAAKLTTAGKLPVAATEHIRKAYAAVRKEMKPLQKKVAALQEQARKLAALLLKK